MKNYGASTLSYDERKAKYTEDFKTEYMRLQPRTSDECNEKKNPDYPRLEAIRKYYPGDFTCWTQMLDFFGLPRYIDRPMEPESGGFTVELVWH